jgi:hypothetical protein
MSTIPASGPDASPQPVPVVDLLRKQADVTFAGLTERHDAALPDALAGSSWYSADPTSLKAALRRLPPGRDADLKTVNPFVNEDNTIDLEAIRAIDGLDVDAVENATGGSLEDLAAAAAPEKELEVTTHKDIVDPRRLALRTLGFQTRYRWQIATNSYAIINPQDAMLPMISAFQKRAETDVFGRLVFDDWGGIVDIYLVFPSSTQTLTLGDLKTVRQSDTADLPDIFASLANVPEECPDCGADTIIDEADDVVVCERCSYRTGSHLDEVDLMHGLRTGYSMRGDRAFYAEPIVFVPQRGTVLPGIGKTRRRRHSGLPNDSDHERAAGRVPMHKWFGQAYDTAIDRAEDVEPEILRSRAITVDFSELPFDIPAFYEYSGIPTTYADTAADHAVSLAADSSNPTLWGLHVSLLIALRDGWSGNNISQDLEAYRELAQQLIQEPAFAIQVAIKEYELQVDDNEDGEEDVLPENQQLLSDHIDDLEPLDGVTAESEADLADQEAQQIQNNLQQTLDGITNP